LIADRYEMLAPASTALALRIPVAHIEGGEVSQGAIDDQVRNALTKLAHIHFASTETARRRVVSMGEEPWRVHRAGAPSLDHLRRSTLLGRAALEARLGLTLSPPTLVAAWHPVTILRDTMPRPMPSSPRLPRLRVNSSSSIPTPTQAVMRSSSAPRLSRQRAPTRTFRELDAVTYWSLLGQADALIGNSSSGIMEAPLLHCRSST